MSREVLRAQSAGKFDVNLVYPGRARRGHFDCQQPDHGDMISSLMDLIRIAETGKVERVAKRVVRMGMTCFSRD